MYIADLHIHSRFSRATSKDCDAPHLDWWARRKGIGLLGTGDFTHPAWRAELKEQLVSAGEGVYMLKEEYRLPAGISGEAPRFVVTGEISSIYKRDGKTRKVHNLILLPSLEAADALSAKLEAVGNIHSDGRPILGMDSRDLMELTLTTCPDAEFIPAHIWTPHFSMFGAFSGFHTIESCFDDMTPHIHAVETGLSSDPPMNWRVSALDGLTLVSHSDAHSPAKLGREANLLNTDRTYPALVHAIRTGDGLLGTIEFFPEEGKYHLDGHRNCGVCLTPQETAEQNGICPVCGRKLTIGVEHRVEELADRPAGFCPENAKPFESLAPLPEVIAASTGGPSSGKRMDAQYERLLHELGPEFYILRQASIEEIARAAGPCVAEGIRRLRTGQVERRPGFDGEYGTISLLTPAEIEQFGGQMSFFSAPAKKAAKPQAKRNRPLTVLQADPAAPSTEMLNPQQRAAVEAREPVVAVVAGPGTGKTKTLVSRIAYLIKERGVKPDEITAVTFTNQAAAEMRQRLEKRLGGKRAVGRMTIGTFHAICLRLLGGARLISRGEALTIASDALQEQQSRQRASSFLQAVSRVKNGASFDAAGLDEALYTAYCAQLKKRGLLDFDDLLSEGLKLDTIGRKGFHYLLVDEFQDINAVQYDLVHVWHRGGKSLFVIGDPDQSIYGFRGATGDCFSRLQSDFSDIREIRLVENYRSAPEVLQAAIPLINRNPGEPRLLSPNRPAGVAVRLIHASDDFAEAVFIAKEISRMTGGIDMLEAQNVDNGRSIRSFSDIAVLCRTHRQLELIESCLKHDDIPCIVSGRDDFLDADEVRGVLAFFHSMQEVRDTAALETAMRLLWNCPADLIRRASDACQKLSRFDPELLRETVRGFGHLELWLAYAEKWLPLLDEKPYKLIARWAEEYGKTPAVDRLYHTAVFHKSFAELWNTLVLGEEADVSRAAGKRWESGAVKLMTLHGAKGLEFPAVFIAGVKAGTLPLEIQGRPADVEEERRLLYVGMTRAREELLLTAGEELSPFLRGLPSCIKEERLKRRERPAEQTSLF